MKDFTKRFLALMSAACMIPLASCADKENGSSSAADTQLTTTEDEAELGEYVLSDSGVKLYYSSEEFPPELMAALEKYFTAFSQDDYESYAECVYPDYMTEMNKYLEADYGYDLSESFKKQCESLRENAGGDFKITRIKAELPEEDGAEKYLTQLGEIFETDFYSTVKEGSDALYDMIFYIMVDVNGEETLLISEFEIVFAEKDGKYYNFG